MRALWIGVPFAIFVATLTRLWFNAPVWDDYDALLGLAIQADETDSLRDWLALVFRQHNEHRIAVTALVTLGMVKVAGAIDFRVLMLLGSLSVLGIFLFMASAFRGRVAPPLVGAAAIVMFQWSYYEASLMGSAALPHLGVNFFAFGCLYFALRDGASRATLAAVFGLLAAASQANGLFALPVAAVGCALTGRKRRAAVLGVFAVLAWALYFYAYAKPPYHPSPLAAFSNPLSTLHLFLVIVGGILSGYWAPTLAGAGILAGLGWAMKRGIWREVPEAAMWTAFLLATAGAAAAGRVGLGVTWASRYAIGSTCLLVIVILSAAALFRPSDRRVMGAAVAAALLLAAGVSVRVWPHVMESSERGQRLRESRVEGGAPADRYGGAFYPELERAHRFLAQAGERGYYRPPVQQVYPWALAPDAPSKPLRAAGFVDKIELAGERLTVTGWTELRASEPSRVLHVASPVAWREAAPVSIVARPDVARALHDPEAVFSGFVLRADYESEEAARQAAARLCLWVESPRTGPSMPVGTPGCPVS